MNYKLYPKKLRVMSIFSAIFTAIVIFACSIALQYLNPEDSATLLFIKLRYPLIAFYSGFSLLCFYLLGIFGNCTFSYDGITFKRSFKEKFISWDVIEKITSTTEPVLYLNIEFKPEHKKQYEGKIKRSYSFEKSDAVIGEVKKYFENITDK